MEIDTAENKRHEILQGSGRPGHSGGLCAVNFSPQSGFMPAFCAASAAATATRGAQSCSALRIHERRRLDAQASDEDPNFLLLFTQSCDTFAGFTPILFKLLFVESTATKLQLLWCRGEASDDMSVPPFAHIYAP